MSPSYDGNSVVYAYRLGNELVVAIGPNGSKPLFGKIIIRPKPLVIEPQQFIDDLANMLPDGVDPVPSTSILYAGFPRSVLTVKPEYQKELEKAIKELNR